MHEGYKVHVTMKQFIKILGNGKVLMGGLSFINGKKKRRMGEVSVKHVH